MLVLFDYFPSINIEYLNTLQAMGFSSIQFPSQFCSRLICSIDGNLNLTGKENKLLKKITFNDPSYLCFCQVLLEENNFLFSTLVNKTKLKSKLRLLCLRIWTFLCLGFSVWIRLIIASFLSHLLFIYSVSTYSSRRITVPSVHIEVHEIQPRFRIGGEGTS